MLGNLFKLAILLAIGVGGFYFYVDRTLVARLNYQSPSSIPSVYSEPFTIASGQTILANLLKEELLSRSYRDVTGTPIHPGEYSVGGDSWTVFPREFQDTQGILVKPAIFTLQKKGDKLQNDSAKSVSFEPVMIAHFGSGELRAASYTPLSGIPKSLQHAVVAIEDERFFHHHGVDIIGILRAIAANIRAGRLVQGGSTLTQQLAKNVLLTPQRTLKRKLTEFAAAVSLETRYTKEQILELYLNEVYLGQDGTVSIHGVGEASKFLFGKKISELTIGESALIAGIIQAPSAYAPQKHLKRAIQRRDLVLQKMVELGYITEAQRRTARETKVRLASGAAHGSRVAPHFVEALYKHLSNSIDLDVASRVGLRVYSSISLFMQRCAEDAIHDGLAAVESNYPAVRHHGKPIESGLVAIEPYSGKIRAWVGGRDYSENQFDHVSQGIRQIGSTVKPFLYLTALDSSLNSYRVATPLTILPDEPMKFDIANQDSWEPENYDRSYRGDVTLRFALENSLNMPAAYIGSRVGIRSVAETLRRFHVSEHPPEVPSLALGTADTTLLRLTAGYAAIANGGIYVTPRMFVSAADGDGHILSTEDLTEERIAQEPPVYVLTNILQGVIERGTGRPVRALGYNGPAAGKTGTSNDTRDAWFVGFTPSLAVGVWVGFDDNSKTALTGAQGAVPVWARFMKCIEPVEEQLPFLAPEGVQFEDVDIRSGGRATRYCPADQVVREVFVQGTEPRDPCSIHGRYGEEPARTDSGRNRRDEREPPRRREHSFWDILFGG